MYTKAQEVEQAYDTAAWLEPRIMQTIETTKRTQKEIKMYTKAQEVEQVYDVAQWDNHVYSEGCYALAVAAARELGGVEVQNANDDGSTSYAPSRTFEFDDNSSVYIMCGGVCVITN